MINYKNILINISFWMVLCYLTYYLFNGNNNIQNYLISSFEKKLFEDFQYKLNNDLIMVNKDIRAVRNSMPDMLDELEKRTNLFSTNGETVILLGN